MPTMSHAPEITHDQVSEVRYLRSKLGHAVRRGTEEEQVEVRRDLAAAKIAQYVERVVSEAPELTDEQRSRLAGLLNGAA